MSRLAVLYGAEKSINIEVYNSRIDFKSELESCQVNGIGLHKENIKGVIALDSKIVSSPWDILKEFNNIYPEFFSTVEGPFNHTFARTSYPIEMRDFMTIAFQAYFTKLRPI